MAPHKLNPRKVSEMRRLHGDPDSALRQADLAAMFDVSEATVRYHLFGRADRKAEGGGVPRGRPKKLDNQQIAYIRKLYGQGEKQIVLALMFKVSKATIQRHVAYSRGRMAAA